MTAPDGSKSMMAVAMGLSPLRIFNMEPGQPQVRMNTDLANMVGFILLTCYETYLHGILWSFM